MKQQKKEVVQTFKLSTNEKKMLKLSATMCNMSVSEFIRKSLLTHNFTSYEK
jgi:uncharacterized protein (DUF1778 family)